MLPVEKACKWKGSYYMRLEVTVKIKPKFIKEIKKWISAYFKRCDSKFK